MGLWAPYLALIRGEPQAEKVAGAGPFSWDANFSQWIRCAVHWSVQIGDDHVLNPNKGMKFTTPHKTVHSFATNTWRDWVLSYQIGQSDWWNPRGGDLSNWSLMNSRRPLPCPLVDRMATGVHWGRYLLLKRFLNNWAPVIKLNSHTTILHQPVCKSTLLGSLENSTRKCLHLGKLKQIKCVVSTV